jgi:hypothetical protein
MTPADFKAWFDGFSEGVGDHPTPQQWARIKERLSEVGGETYADKLRKAARDTNVRTWLPTPKQDPFVIPLNGPPTC